MKNFLVLLAFIFGQNSIAAIPGSDYELRHQDEIEKSLTSKCGSFRNLFQQSSQQEEIRVDQGIRDVKFVTILKGEQRIEQNMFDSYKITVESYFYDSFDHSSGNWGSYSVSSVKCEFE